MRTLIIFSNPNQIQMNGCRMPNTETYNPPPSM